MAISISLFIDIKYIIYHTQKENIVLSCHNVSFLIHMYRYIHTCIYRISKYQYAVAYWTLKIFYNIFIDTLLRFRVPEEK